MTDATPAPRIVSPETPVDHERTVIFTGTEKVLKHDDNGQPYHETVEKEFTIENRVRPSLVYGYMRRLRSLGAEQAQAWMLDKVLGDDALAYLEDQDDLTFEDNEALNQRIKEITMGGLQGPKA